MRDHHCVFGTAMVAAAMLLASPGARDSLPDPDGTGLIVAGGVVGGVGLVGRLVVTGLTHPVDVTFDADRSVEPFVSGWALGAGLSAATVGAGLAVLGAGMAKRGRWAARDDQRAGLAFDYRRREIAGWTIFGLGLASWLTTRFAGQLCPDEGPSPGPDFTGPDPERLETRCALRVLDATYYPTVALMAVGVALGPFATAYRYQRGRVRELKLGVMTDPRAPGIVVSGRF